jgi:hypothetical protein
MSNAALNTLYGELAQLRRELTERDRRIAELERRVKELAGKSEMTWEKRAAARR